MMATRISPFGLAAWPGLAPDRAKLGAPIAMPPAVRVFKNLLRVVNFMVQSRCVEEELTEFLTDRMWPFKIQFAPGVRTVLP